MRFDRKEVKQMTYNKPQVVAVGTALECVQMVDKPAKNQADFDLKHTPTAYEADE
jgi:hypothetical protein